MFATRSVHSSLGFHLWCKQRLQSPEGADGMRLSLKMHVMLRDCVESIKALRFRKTRKDISLCGSLLGKWLVLSDDVKFFAKRKRILPQACGEFFRGLRVLSKIYLWLVKQESFEEDSRSYYPRSADLSLAAPGHLPL